MSVTEISVVSWHCRVVRGRTLMPLLVHLRVLSVGRLRITAAVTIGTVVCVAIGSSILSHALRKPWTLRAVLRRGIVARGSRLVPDGRQLRMRGTLSWHTNGLSHLAVHRSFPRGATLMTLLRVGTVALVLGLALSLFLLLLRLPLFANFLKLYTSSSSQH
jgi:hypothetical protein